MNENKKPWEMDKSLVDVVKAYRSEIISEKDKDNYHIEFYDYDMSVVESSLEKEKFEVLPYPVGIGTHFWIVFYKLKREKEIKSICWPVAEYWHESWK